MIAINWEAEKCSFAERSRSKSSDRIRDFDPLDFVRLCAYPCAHAENEPIARKVNNNKFFRSFIAAVSLLLLALCAIGPRAHVYDPSGAWQKGHKLAESNNAIQFNYILIFAIFPSPVSTFAETIFNYSPLGNLLISAISFLCVPFWIYAFFDLPLLFDSSSAVMSILCRLLNFWFRLISASSFLLALVLFRSLQVKSFCVTLTQRKHSASNGKKTNYLDLFFVIFLAGKATGWRLDVEPLENLDGIQMADSRLEINKNEVRVCLFPVVSHVHLTRKWKKSPTHEMISEFQIVRRQRTTTAAAAWRSPERKGEFLLKIENPQTRMACKMWVKLNMEWQ